LRNEGEGVNRKDKSGPTRQLPRVSHPFKKPHWKQRIESLPILTSEVAPALSNAGSPCSGGVHLAICSGRASARLASKASAPDFVVAADRRGRLCFSVILTGATRFFLGRVARTTVMLNRDGLAIRS